MEDLREEIETLWRALSARTRVIEALERRVEELERRLREAEPADVIDFPMSAAAEDRLCVDRRA